MDYTHSSTSRSYQFFVLYYLSEPVVWQGWLYFSNPAVNTVTDQDIRKPKTLDLVERTITFHYPLGTLGEGMELHLFNLSPVPELDASSIPFNLIVNHQSCVASYQDDLTSDGVALLSPARRA